MLWLVCSWMNQKLLLFLYLVKYYFPMVYQPPLPSPQWSFYKNACDSLWHNYNFRWAHLHLDPWIKRIQIWGGGSDRCIYKTDIHIYGHTYSICIRTDGLTVDFFTTENYKTGTTAIFWFGVSYVPINPKSHSQIPNYSSWLKFSKLKKFKNCKIKKSTFSKLKYSKFKIAIV